MRKRIWRAGGTVALRSAIVRWMAMAHSTACWTLRNSARMPSPAVSWIRPPWASTMRQDDGLMPLEGRDGGGLVLGHQAAIPDNIRHQDGGEPALDVCLVHMAP